MIDRRRALHIAPLMPDRSGNGLAMRQGMFLEALSRNFDTHLLVLPVAGGGAMSEMARSLAARITVIPTAGRQDTHFTLLSRIIDPATRLNAFVAYGRSTLAASLSGPVLADLRTAVAGERFDLIHVGRSYLADALSEFAPGPSVTLDLDEDEWTSYRELADRLRGTDPAAADEAVAEADAMSRLVARSASGISRHFISSEADAGWVEFRHPDIQPEVIANAVEVPPEVRRNDDGATLLFLGSFGYAPNLDAMNWFAGEVWPLVLSQSGQSPARLLIAGRDSGRLETLRGHPRVEILGEVPDVADAYADATLFVAPLRAGAGTRLKLIEAAAHRVPIVTTSIGARGLRFISNRDLLIADEPATFASAILASLADPAGRAARAASALSLVQNHHDRARTVERLSCRLREIAAR